MSEPTPTTPTTHTTRQSIRANIFQSRKVNIRLVEFFGETIELRQPTLGDILTAREDADRQGAVIDTLVKHAYVPGTDERVFEEADAEALKELPFGASFIAVTDALEELSEVNFLDRKRG